MSAAGMSADCGTLAAASSGAVTGSPALAIAEG
jgi:hypothetical protein